MAVIDPNFVGPRRIVSKEFSPNPLEQFAWWMGLGDQEGAQAAAAPVGPPEPGFGQNIMQALSGPFEAGSAGYEAGGIPGWLAGFISEDVAGTGRLMEKVGETVTAPFDYFGEQYEKGRQAVEGAPPEAPAPIPAPDFDFETMLATLGGQGAGKDFSYETPVPVGPELPQFPTGKKDELLAAFEAQAPDQMDDLLLNIAQALVTSETGTPIIRSIVKGGTKGLIEAGAEEKKYKRELAKFKADLDQQEFDAGMDLYKTNYQVNADVQDALTPKFVGGKYFVTPERKGDKIVHKVKDVSKSNVTQRAMMKMSDPENQFEAMQMMNPELAVAALNDAMGAPAMMKLTAQGVDSKTVNSIGKSRAIALIKQARPELIQQLRMQMMMSALGGGAANLSAGVNP